MPILDDQHQKYATSLILEWKFWSNAKNLIAENSFLFAWSRFWEFKNFINGVPELSISHCPENCILPWPATYFPHSFIYYHNLFIATALLDTTTKEDALLWSVLKAHNCIPL